MGGIDRSDDRQAGSVVPAVGLVMALAVATIVALVLVVEELVARAEAQGAADAAALAAVVEGQAGAADLAASNGAELVMFERRRAMVGVVVERSGRRATAWASIAFDRD